MDFNRLHRLRSLTIQGLSVNLRARWPDGFKLAALMLDSWSSPTLPSHIINLKLDFLFQGKASEVLDALESSKDTEKDWIRLDNALMRWSWLESVGFEGRCFVNMGNGRLGTGYLPRKDLVRVLKEKMKKVWEKLVICATEETS